MVAQGGQLIFSRRHGLAEKAAGVATQGGQGRWMNEPSSRWRARRAELAWPKRHGATELLSAEADRWFGQEGEGRTRHVSQKSDGRLLVGRDNEQRATREEGFPYVETEMQAMPVVECPGRHLDSRPSEEI